MEAVGFDANGRQVGDAQVHTAAAPVAIRLTLHTGPGGLRADGADMALVDVEVVDANGQRCPTADNRIDFTLDGAAEWRGGIAQEPDNYILAKSLPVESGVSRILLRSLPHAGRITLRAVTPGLQPALIMLRSRKVKVMHGLSRVMPDAGLTSYLNRGSTPATPSFTPWRQTIVVSSATAGAHAGDAAASYDDNETTAWENDGRLDTAWIQYQFAQPESPTEVDLKLNSFRHRRYPIRITIDGQTAWEGLTPTSLGYCDLPLRPLRGTHLRIALTGPPVETGLDGGTAEITGKEENLRSGFAHNAWCGNAQYH